MVHCTLPILVIFPHPFLLGNLLFSTFPLPGILKFHNLVWYRPFLCVSLIFCFFFPGSYYSDVGSLRLTRWLTFFPSCFAFCLFVLLPGDFLDCALILLLNILFCLPYFQFIEFSYILSFFFSLMQFQVFICSGVFITPINSFFLFCFVLF